MNPKYTHEECYKILNTSAGVSWKELRKAYKVQIQKWHPDRFKEDSSKKNAAEIKIKELNKAYQQLSNYYRENNSLPGIERPKVAAVEKAANKEPAKPSPRPTPPPPPRKPQKKEIQGKNKSSGMAISFLAIVVIFSVYSALNETSENKSADKRSKNIENDKIDNKARPHQSLKQDEPDVAETKEDKKNIEEKQEKIIIQKMFSYGSTIGDVIMIQGAPTKVEERFEGEIWYYGDSKVYFTNGVVQGWERKLGSPLHASISGNRSTKNIR